MLARAAEKNPSIFLPEGPRDTVKEIIPRLLNIAQVTNNSWGNTKFLLAQFKPSPAPISNLTKAEKKVVSHIIGSAKSLAEVAEKLHVELGAGQDVLEEIAARIRARIPVDAFALRASAIKDGTAVIDQPTDGTSADNERPQIEG